MSTIDCKSIVAHCDHTLLSPDATWFEIKKACTDAIDYGAAAICLAPIFVKWAKKFVGDKLKICTVIGFPNGYQLLPVKKLEAEIALADGADELDMVVNIPALKGKDYNYILNEIKEIKALCGDKLLKVIIECCLLTEEEKLKMCELVTEAGADYIKTSTGFSTGGATKEDVALLVANVGKGVKVKAAGGIKTLEDAQDFLDLGADRLGTSRIINLIKAEKTE